MSIRFECETNIGQKRQVNEDSFWPKTNQHDHLPGDPYGMLFIIADGMGGHGAGDVASELAVAEISERYYALGDDYSDIGDRLRLAIQAAHQKIYEKAAHSPDFQDMGTTVAVAVIKYDESEKQGEVWLAWAGDSRVYLLRRGQLIQLTRDHSKVWPLIEAGQITWDELHFHPERSRVTNALTARRSSVTPEVENFELDPGDQLLLCSDGLSGEVRLEEIEQTLTTYPLQQALQLLIKKANAPKEVYKNGQKIVVEGGNDNISSIVIEIPDGEPHLVSSSPVPAPQLVSSPPRQRGSAIWGILVLLLLVGAGLLFFVFSSSGNFEISPSSTRTEASASIAPATKAATESSELVVEVNIPTSTSNKSTDTPEPTLNSQETQSSSGETRLPTVTRGPMSSPTTPPTPTSTSLPITTSTPFITSTQTATVVNLANYPIPELIEPKSFEEDEHQYDASKDRITFVWRWPGELTDKLSFEIRIGLQGTELKGAHNAEQLRQETTFKRLEDGNYSVELRLGNAVGVTSTSSDYFWSVGLVRVQPYEWLGVESEHRRIGIIVAAEDGGAGE